jgi:hypothetical protein
MDDSKYDLYCGKLKNAFAENDYYGIGFYLSALNAPTHKIKKYLIKGVETDRSTCESIYKIKRLALEGFYQSIYRNDTILFNSIFKLCNDKLGSDSFNNYMFDYNEETDLFLKSKPQLDSLLIDTSLIASLEKIRERDQSVRIEIASIHTSEQQKIKLEDDKIWIDSLNLVEIDSILLIKGFPEIVKVGYDLSGVVFLVLHHQSSLEIRIKYRHVIVKNYSQNKVNLYDTYTNLFTIDN